MATQELAQTVNNKVACVVVPISYAWICFTHTLTNEHFNCGLFTCAVVCLVILSVFFILKYILTVLLLWSNSHQSTTHTMI